MPVDVDPTTQPNKWIVKGSGQIGKFIQHRSLYTLGIEVANNEPVTLRSSERLREDLVGDPVQGVVDVLIATPAVRELSAYSKGPSPIEQFDESVRSLETTHTDHSASVGDMRAARSAGRSPATAPMSSAAPKPPPVALSRFPVGSSANTMARCHSCGHLFTA